MMIDRMAPTLRPTRKPRGFQQWRSLLFLHWPVPIASLRPLVPPALELDLYDGTAYVGIVPFAMHGVRSRWWPASFAFNFLETNVRTYVHYKGRPGVYFFSLDAASGLAVWAAKRFWGLPYHRAEMSMKQDGNETIYQTVRHRSEARLAVRYRVGKPLGAFRPDTLDFFFLERYLLFLQRRSRICVGQVHHTPYPAHQVDLLDIAQSLVSANGLPACQGPPAFAHFAPGVDVEIYGLE